MARPRKKPESLPSMVELLDNAPVIIGADQVVKYVGTAQAKIIDVKHWQELGINDQGTVIFRKENKWTVPASAFSHDALQYVDENDKTLTVVRQ